MKKLIIAILTLITLPASAQISGDGYYRVQNNGTERYVSITDDIIGGIDMTATTVDMANITTIRDYDKVKSNPGTIIYISKANSKNEYDLEAQGISIHAITGGQAYVKLTHQDEDVYTISATAKGITKWLYDITSKNYDESSVTDYGDAVNQYWRIKPLNTTNNYIGFTPTLQTSDGWYGTFYAAFPFRVASSDVHVYYVDGVKEGVFQLKEITDDIKPANTPMIIKCSTNDASKNQITPVVATTTAPTDNKLSGTLFCSFKYEHVKNIKFDDSKMRLLGLNSAGELIFTKDKSSLTVEKSKYYLPKNTAYLYDASGLSGEYKLVSRETYTGIRNIDAEATPSAAQGTYTLTGIRVDDTKPLRPGIYIQNGKKVVVK